MVPQGITAKKWKKNRNSSKSLFEKFLSKFIENFLGNCFRIFSKKETQEIIGEFLQKFLIEFQYLGVPEEIRSGVLR